MSAQLILPGLAEGPVLASDEALSFWGGVDPASGRVIDAHHPLQGRIISGKVLMLPSTRGSCTGSGVLLDLILNGRGPAALVFSEPEDVVTLGALVAAEMFGQALPVLRLSRTDFAAVAAQERVRISADAITAPGLTIPFSLADAEPLDLSESDIAMLNGEHGEAARQGMRILTAMARNQGAARLIPVSRVHIDGCIYASPANLTFAERMAALGAQVVVPVTMNAISVDRENWQDQAVPPRFGAPAAKLADAYVSMGCRPTFTCAPYLLEDAPKAGEDLGWSESNAVIYANSVLGARSPKHPDFLDLCIALTGRAPRAGVYLDAARAPQRVIAVTPPAGADDLFWPLLGWLAGRAAPDCIPILTGLERLCPGPDDLKALCAAFGTTSAAPMLHLEGITPEAPLGRAAKALAEGAAQAQIGPGHFRKAWEELNSGPEQIELVAIGSPHASLNECRALAAALAGRPKAKGVAVIITAGRQVIAAARAEGLLQKLQDLDVQIIPDLCWCSISEPVFPPQTRAVMTNSGKYAHYGPGLSGRALRLGSMQDCAEAAATGFIAKRPPRWLA